MSVFSTIDREGQRPVVHVAGRHGAAVCPSCRRPSVTTNGTGWRDVIDVVRTLVVTLSICAPLPLRVRGLRPAQLRRTLRGNGRGGASERALAFFADLQRGRATRTVARNLGVLEHYLRLAVGRRREHPHLRHVPGGCHQRPARATARRLAGGGQGLAHTQPPRQRRRGVQQGMRTPQPFPARISGDPALATRQAATGINRQAGGPTDIFSGPLQVQLSPLAVPLLLKPRYGLTAMRSSVSASGSACATSGSSARWPGGEATPVSDLDLLVDVDRGHGYFDMAGFALGVEDELGVMTPVTTPGGLKPRIRDRVLREAVAL